MHKLSDIEGIGEVYAAKLKAAGVTGVANLLEKGGSKAGRRSLAECTGVSEALILKWVNRADLGRVRGVGTQYADLLEAAGVDSVPELAQRNAANLHARMAELNAEKRLVRQLPASSRVEDWVAQAKGLPRAVSH